VRGGEILNMLNQTPQDAFLGAEIGVFKAHLSAFLLESKPELSLILVDPWEPVADNTPYFLTGDPHATSSRDEHNTIYADAVENVKKFGDRVKIIHKTSVDAALDVANETLDFVFLDGDHSYEGVMADLEAWIPKIKKGGFIGGHDYANPNYVKLGVDKAVTEWFKHEPQRGSDMTW
jgi:hypothetical protein